MLFLTASLNQESARAASLEEMLIMPGPVIEAHADVEGDCRKCHAPLSDKTEGQLCVVCHEEVGSDIENKQGLHGRVPMALEGECSVCHTEHEGRNKNVIELDEASFKHLVTDFLLLGAHRNASCSDCHREGEPRRLAETTCIGCHRADDPHNGQLGELCNDCHTENDWTEAKFDHDSTGFPLTAGHGNVMCSACHQSEDLAEVGRTCVACHRSDDVHRGRNGTRCADCHNTVSWSNITFNHRLLTGFPLDGGHRGLACQDCHSASDFKDLASSDCNACHGDDDVHKGKNGTDCGSCHGTNDWKRVIFDHTEETGFVLPAGHQDLACTACHKGSITDSLARDCGGCHIDDDVHKGQLGSQCESCHSETSWTTQIRFDHDLTPFPLVGAHSDVVCTDCHESAAFHDADETCIACHQKDDKHRGGLGTECQSCHNPSNWRSWAFDHDVRTDFVLTGAHSGLECAACHTKPLAKGTPQDCKFCHDRDDPHFGRFGTDCGRCHTTSSFSEINGM